MGKLTKCSIIVSDDFNNILICQKGKGKHPKNLVWQLFGKDISGKETGEKCITKSIDKDLKCTIFNLNPFKEYIIDESTSDFLMVYTGNIKEQMTYHKEVVQTKWVSKNQLDALEFQPGEKEIILEFFNSLI